MVKVGILCRLRRKVVLKNCAFTARLLLALIATSDQLLFAVDPYSQDNPQKIGTGLPLDLGPTFDVKMPYDCRDKSVDDNRTTPTTEVKVVNNPEEDERLHKPKCTSLPDAIKRAKEHSFDKRISKLEWEKAIKNIGAAKNRLLPGFRLRITLDFTEFIPDLFSFLYPSNHARKHQAEELAVANRYLYLNVVADQVIGVQELYYTIHRDLRDIAIMEAHTKFNQQWVEVQKARHKAGVITADKSTRVQAHYLKDLTDLEQFKKQRDATYPNLAVIMALNSDWDDLIIEPISLPDLSDLTPIHADTWEATVKNRAFTTKAFAHEILAAGHATAARQWDFLSADESPAEGKLGFYHGDYVDIGRINQSQARERRNQYVERLMASLRGVVNTYNHAVETYKQSSEGVGQARKTLEFIVSQFKETGALDEIELLSALDQALELQQRENTAQHDYLIAYAQLKRLLLHGEFYDDIGKYCGSSEVTSRNFRRQRRGLFNLFP